MWPLMMSGSLVELVAVGEELVEVDFTEDGAQRGLGEL